MSKDEKAPILIRVAGSGNTSITLDESDNAEYITVDTEEEKSYLEYLRDKDKYSVKGLHTQLSGMREYQEWQNEVENEE